MPIEQQQILMLNYSKMRQSVQKNSSKKSLSKATGINKSHTSSINIKLSQELTTVDNNKIGMKSIFKDKCQSYLQTLTKHPQINNYIQSHKKYSVKLQSNEKQNLGRKKQVKENYQIGVVRPFQETNRYLETERINKQYQKNCERSISKNKPLKIKNDQNDTKMKTQYTQSINQKYRKETPSKHVASNCRNMVKIPLTQLKNLMDELLKEQREVNDIKKQLDFYKRHAEKESNNPVFHALKS